MYTEEQIRDKIIDTINIIIEESNDSDTITKYRRPVIGFASADDPLYARASEIIGYDVLQPRDLLPEAESVVSFFVPFDVATIKYARARQQISNREWSLGYYELNLLIGKIMNRVVKELHAMGIKAASEPVTENYDHIELATKWPHKTSAYIAGVGTFGINRLIISPLGCAGRLGTVVFSEKVTPTQRPDQENCLYKREGKCGVCAKMCPSKAIRYNSFNRFVCNLHDNTMRENPSALDRGDFNCSSGPCGFYRIPNFDGHHVWIGREKCEDIAVRLK
jgi:epoxyqueuosine reductase